jgi:hypothetical protein
MLEEEASGGSSIHAASLKEDAMSWIWGLVFLALYWLSHLFYL